MAARRPHSRRRRPLRFNASLVRLDVFHAVSPLQTNLYGFNASLVRLDVVSHVMVHARAANVSMPVWFD